MNTGIRKHFTSAHLLGAVAIFIALGGTAFAIKNNSIGTNKLKNNAVKTKKIANNAVTGAKVDESSLSKVPSAATADTATSAGSAATAQTAGTATSAQSATTATTAAVAETADRVNGLTLTQIRPFVESATDGTPTPLVINDPLATVIELDVNDGINVPSGGATIVVSGSLRVDGAAAAIVQCRARVGGTLIDEPTHSFSTTAFVQQTPVVASTNLTTGTDVPVSIDCQTAGAAATIQSADMVVEVYPVG